MYTARSVSCMLKVKQKNKGWFSRLEKRYVGANRVVACGFPEGTEAATVRYPDGPRVVDVALANNYGQGVPKRDFMNRAGPEIQKKTSGILRSAVRGLNEKGIDSYETKLKVAGNVGAGEIAQSIVKLRDPPNSEETIKRKKSDNPLIDTSLMMQSVTHIVRKT